MPDTPRYDEPSTPVPSSPPCGIHQQDPYSWAVAIKKGSYFIAKLIIAWMGTHPAVLTKLGIPPPSDSMRLALAAVIGFCLTYIHDAAKYHYPNVSWL